LKTEAYHTSTSNLFLQFDNEKHQKYWRWYVQWLLMATIFAQSWRPVASSEALDLLYQAMCAVLYRRTTTAIKMASKVGAFVCCYFVCYCPGGHQGNTEQVVARWQRSVASSLALNMMHPAMHFVLHRHIHKAFKMGRDGGTI
jgi:hypothetical protein